MDSIEIFPLSLLNDFLYCPRRAALKAVEGYRGENIHTVLGDQVHEHADLNGFEVARGVTLLRALPVWSDRLGLSGKCDIVEAEPENARRRVCPGNVKSLRPVEYKKGRKRPFENDDVQLCAQGLCLEEMFGISISSGAIFHAQSKRRREVVFTDDLRAKTERAIHDLRDLLEEDHILRAIYKPQCSECSLYHLCLPEITSAPPNLTRVIKNLYKV